MSYNFTLAILPDTELAELTVVDPEPRAFDDVATLRSFDLVGAQVGPNVVLVDPLFGQGAKELAAAHDRQVYIVAFGGVSDTYALQAFGAQTRLRVLVEGSVEEDQGEPLTAEQAFTAGDDAEDSHAAVFEALLGADLNVVFGAPFVTLVPEADLLA